MRMAASRSHLAPVCSRVASFPCRSCCRRRAASQTDGAWSAARPFSRPGKLPERIRPGHGSPPSTGAKRAECTARVSAILGQLGDSSAHHTGRRPCRASLGNCLGGSIPCRPTCCYPSPSAHGPTLAGRESGMLPRRWVSVVETTCKAAACLRGSLARSWGEGEGGEASASSYCL